MNRIVNIRYRVDGMNFDAAVDCDWQLYLYQEISEEKVPVELHCIDNPDWDTKMIYMLPEDFDGRKVINRQEGSFGHTFVDMRKVVQETRNWIIEKRYMEDVKKYTILGFVSTSDIDRDSLEDMSDADALRELLRIYGLFPEDVSLFIPELNKVKDIVNVFGVSSPFRCGNWLQDDYNDEFYDGEHWLRVMHLTGEEIESIVK